MAWHRLMASAVKNMEPFYHMEPRQEGDDPRVMPCVVASDRCVRLLLYQLMRCLDTETFHINLIEEYPCGSKSELRARELVHSLALNITMIQVIKKASDDVQRLWDKKLKEHDANILYRRMNELNEGMDDVELVEHPMLESSSSSEDDMSDDTVTGDSDMSDYRDTGEDQAMVEIEIVEDERIDAIVDDWVTNETEELYFEEEFF